MALPTVETLRTASFQSCVKHSETILKSFATSPTSKHITLLESLTHSSNGIRGLFVTLLSNEAVPLADQPLGDDFLAVVAGTNIEEDQRIVLRDLISKNVVMPRCMVVSYSRNPAQDSLRQASEQTANRAARVAKEVLNVDAGIRVVLQEMLEGMEKLQGRFEPFVRKWNYDEEMRKAAASALNDVLTE